MLPENYIGLNVGGKIYLTSRTTLTRYPNNFFATLIDRDIPYATDDHGNYLIERDGTLFRHVLNFLRCGELVLPKGFDDFDLLEREAEFYQLEALHKCLRNATIILTQNESFGIAVGIGGSRSLYKITRESLTKEKDSFFTAVMDGQKILPMDTKGNYIINKDNSLFHHIAEYLANGRIVSDVTAEVLPRLRMEAKYFRLKMFAHHVESVRFMQQQKDKRDLYIHLFHSQNGQCIAYSNQPSSIPLRGPDRIGGPPFHIVTWKTYQIGVGGNDVFVGVVRSADIPDMTITSAESVRESLERQIFQNKTVFKNFLDSSLEMLKLSDECTRIDVHIRVGRAAVVHP